MTSRKKINIFYFNGVNVAKHWHVAGEVFAISDCLVLSVLLLVLCSFTPVHAHISLPQIENIKIYIRVWFISY